MIVWEVQLARSSLQRAYEDQIQITPRRFEWAESAKPKAVFNFLSVEEVARKRLAANLNKV